MSSLFPRLAVDLRLLRQPELRLVPLAVWANLVVTELTQVALPFQIFRQTHSPLANGPPGLARIGRLLSFQAVGRSAGHDARDCPNLVRVTDLSQAVLRANLLFKARLPKPLL